MAFKKGFVGDLHFGESRGHVEEAGIYVLYTFTLPETNSSHLKMDGWSTIVSFWDGLFSGASC